MLGRDAQLLVGSDSKLEERESEYKWWISESKIFLRRNPAKNFIPQINHKLLRWLMKYFVQNRFGWNWNLFCCHWIENCVVMKNVAATGMRQRKIANDRHHAVGRTHTNEGYPSICVATDLHATSSLNSVWVLVWLTLIWTRSFILEKDQWTTPYKLWMRGTNETIHFILLTMLTFSLAFLSDSLTRRRQLISKWDTRHSESDCFKSKSKWTMPIFCDCSQHIENELKFVFRMECWDYKIRFHDMMQYRR